MNAPNMKEVIGKVMNRVGGSHRQMNITKVYVLGMVVLSVCVFLLLYDYPKKLDLTYPAVEFRTGDVNSADITSIKIKGKLRKPLFGNRQFIGEIIIDKYDMTKSYSLIGFELSTNNIGLLSYGNTRNGESLLDMFGAIYLSKDFESLTIELNEPVGGEQKARKNLVIAAPATHYDDALAIYQSLVNDE
jgi:hypothetical protein